MCGIAGIMRFDDEPIDMRRLYAMRDHLRHRGPDGEGVGTWGRCGFAHTRLAVLDIFGGEQPMELPAQGDFGHVSLVFNGEVYNHRELRRKLERRGHRFMSSHCDTEVIIHGFREFGEDLPKHLHGMWAFALWDSREQKLHLCRDRTGKKPLFMWRQRDNATRSNELRFASLVGTLVQGAHSSDQLKPSQLAMLQYLRFGYTELRSLVDDIEEVPAAHWVTVDRSGRATYTSYWQPPPVSRTSTAMGAVEGAREVIAEAVAARLDADVPLGCFLSGGIDSSVVAAMAAKSLAARGAGPLRTYSVAMDHAGYDESAHAQLVAKHIGADHTVLQVDTDRDVMADLERLIAMTGEPTADSSLLPTYWLSQAAREHVRVALTGDGGDELFGGYDRYRAMALLARYRYAFAPLPASMIDHSYPKSTRRRLARLIRAARGSTPKDRFNSMVQLFDDDQIAELGVMPDQPPQRMHDWPTEPDPVQAAMRWDLGNYLPFDVLRKVDRASMAVALEVRCPILDTQVCDLATHLPVSVLMPKGKPKALLRKIASSLVPESITSRPKQGFALPIGQWFRTRLREPLHDRLLDATLFSMGFSRQPIERMLQRHMAEQEDYTHQLFALLELAIWSDWMKNRAQPGRV